LTFESESKLTRIEPQALDGCSLLKSIVIPRSILALENNWTGETSLDRIIFQSAASLRNMIANGRVDLREGCEIQFVECDCPLDFPGYSVQPVQDASDVFNLVKN
jgi:hypothetical protein